MKALKIILVIIGVLIAIYLIMCAMGPKDFQVNRTTTIGASADVIYDQVYNLENWKHWSPWADVDTTMEITYGEKTTGVGASYSWTSEKMGGGSLEIVEAEPNKSLRTALQFDNWDGTSYGVWNFEQATEDSTNVTWGIESSEIPFFMRGSMLLMNMDAQVGKDFEEGLANLKEFVEEQLTMPAEYRGFVVKRTTYPGATYAGIRERISMDEMESFFSENFAKVQQAAAEQQLEPAGPPAGLYYEWDEENNETEVVAAFPFVNAPDMVDDIEVINVPTTEALLIDYYGSYDGLGKAHYAMDDYIKERNIQMGAPVIESYITDPGQEPDTAQWYTQIWYLIAETE